MTEATFERIARAPAYQAVAMQIREQILSGAIVPGNYLPTENDFADQLGVTRQTMREAIRLLENAGLVERGKQRRLRVARPNEQTLRTSHSDALVLGGITYHELWQFEMTLDPGIAALAAERCATKSDESIELVERLRQNLDDTRAVLSDPEALTEADIAFHALVAEATGNRAIQLARLPTISLLFPSYAHVIRALGPGRRLLDAHTHIVTAIAAGDAEVASEWMAKHVRDFRRGCEMAGVDMNAPVQRLPGD